MLAYCMLSAFGVAVGRALWPEPIGLGGLLNFDADHYRAIAEDGYVGFRMAFFPLFPLIWRISGLDAVGITVLNAFFFLGSALLLAKELRVSWASFIAWLVVPGTIFYFLPYSEATFFVGATTLLIGVRRGSILWGIAGIMVCSLSRPAFAVLLPAVAIAVLFRHGPTRRALIECTVYALTAVAGLALVSFIQYQDTGDWMGYISQQKGWGNSLRLPAFPLTSWGGAASTRLDAVAFLVGVASGVDLLARIRARIVKGTSTDPVLALSLAYISGISLLVLLFRGGELFSLNRFVFACPFFLVVINHHIVSKRSFKAERIVMVFLMILAGFLVFGSYVHIQTFLAYALIAAYLTFCLVIPGMSKHRGPAFWVWASITFVIQVFFYLRFTSGGWVA